MYSLFTSKNHWRPAPFTRVDSSRKLFGTCSRAFTLIELLIYIALFALMMTGALAGVAAILESAQRSAARAQLETDGTFLVEKIDWLIQSNDLVEPGIGMQSPALSLKSSSGEKITITKNANAVMISRGTSPPLPLTDTHIQLDSMLFTHAGTARSSIDPEHVDVLLVLQVQPAHGPAVVEKFTQTIYLAAP